MFKQLFPVLLVPMILVGAGCTQAQDGSLQIENSQVVSGTLWVYMNSIKNLDIKDEKMNTTLVKHLESEDFFSVANNPIAMFSLLEVVSVEGLSGVTHRITG